MTTGAIESKKRWREANRKYHREYSAKRRRENASQHVLEQRKRRRALKQRTPPWLPKEEIMEMKKMYALAREKTKSLNQKFEIDHIVPLQGKDVSGLHVPWNLRIVTSSLNRSKALSMEVAFV